MIHLILWPDLDGFECVHPRAEAGVILYVPSSGQTLLLPGLMLVVMDLSCLLSVDGSAASSCLLMSSCLPVFLSIPLICSFPCSFYVFFFFFLFFFST